MTTLEGEDLYTENLTTIPIMDQPSNEAGSTNVGSVLSEDALPKESNPNDRNTKQDSVVEHDLSTYEPIEASKSAITTGESAPDKSTSEVLVVEKSLKYGLSPLEKASNGHGSAKINKAEPTYASQENSPGENITVESNAIDDVLIDEISQRVTRKETVEADISQCEESNPVEVASIEEFIPAENIIGHSPSSELIPTEVSPEEHNTKNSAPIARAAIQPYSTGNNQLNPVLDPSPIKPTPDMISKEEHIPVIAKLTKIAEAEPDPNEYNSEVVSEKIDTTECDTKEFDADSDDEYDSEKFETEDIDTREFDNEGTPTEHDSKGVISEDVVSKEFDTEDPFLTAATTGHVQSSPNPAERPLKSERASVKSDSMEQFLLESDITDIIAKESVQNEPDPKEHNTEEIIAANAVPTGHALKKTVSVEPGTSEAAISEASQAEFIPEKADDIDYLPEQHITEQNIPVETVNIKGDSAELNFKELSIAKQFVKETARAENMAAELDLAESKPQYSSPEELIGDKVIQPETVHVDFLPEEPDYEIIHAVEPKTLKTTASESNNNNAELKPGQIPPVEFPDLESRPEVYKSAEFNLAETVPVDMGIAESKSGKELIVKENESPEPTPSDSAPTELGEVEFHPKNYAVERFMSVENDTADSFIIEYPTRVTSKIHDDDKTAPVASYFPTEVPAETDTLEPDHQKSNPVDANSIEKEWEPKESVLRYYITNKTASSQPAPVKDAPTEHKAEENATIKAAATKHLSAGNNILLENLPKQSLIQKISQTLFGKLSRYPVAESDPDEPYAEDTSTAIVDSHEVTTADNDLNELIFGENNSEERVAEESLSTDAATKYVPSDLAIAESAPIELCSETSTLEHIRELPSQDLSMAESNCKVYIPAETAPGNSEESIYQLEFAPKASASGLFVPESALIEPILKDNALETGLSKIISEKYHATEFILEESIKTDQLSEEYTPTELVSPVSKDSSQQKYYHHSISITTAEALPSKFLPLNYKPEVHATLLPKEVGRTPEENIVEKSPRALSLWGGDNREEYFNDRFTAERTSIEPVILDRTSIEPALLEPAEFGTSTEQILSNVHQNHSIREETVPVKSITFEQAPVVPAPTKAGPGEDSSFVSRKFVPERLSEDEAVAETPPIQGSNGKKEIPTTNNGTVYSESSIGHPLYNSTSVSNSSVGHHNESTWDGISSISTNNGTVYSESSIGHPLYNSTPVSNSSVYHHNESTRDRISSISNIECYYTTGIGGVNGTKEIPGNIGMVGSESSIGHPLHKISSVNSSLLHYHNQSASEGPSGISKIKSTGKKNVSLYRRDGIIYLRILRGYKAIEDTNDIKRLARMVQIGEQKIEQAEAVNLTLKKKQDTLQHKIRIIQKQINEQDSHRKVIHEKYNALLQNYNHTPERFGVTGQADVKAIISKTTNLGPAYDDLCTLGEKQKERIVELRRKIKFLNEEYLSVSCRDVIEREENVYKSSEDYIDTLVKNYEMSIEKTTKQAKKLKNLEENLESIYEQNKELKEEATIARLQNTCITLELELKELLKINKSLLKKNRDINLQKEMPKSATANAGKIIMADKTNLPSRRRTKLLAEQISSRKEEMERGHNFYKYHNAQLDSQVYRQKYPTKRDLKKSKKFPQSVLNYSSVHYTSISYLFDGSIPDYPPKRKNRLHNRSSSKKPHIISDDITTQVRTVKEDVKGMKKVLNQYKKVLQDILDQPDSR